MHGPRSFRLSRAAATLALVPLTGGCLGPSTGPLALSSPSVGRPVDLASVPVPKVQVASEPAPESDVAQSDHVPTADEIFQFHPKGAPWRQPFLIDPKDGPLKIRTYSAAELVETAPVTPGTEPPKPRLAKAHPVAPKAPAADQPQ